MEGGDEESFETYSAFSEQWTFVRVYATDEGIAVYFHDVTGWKKAEASLHRSEQIYRAIGETIRWGIWICDPERKKHVCQSVFPRHGGDDARRML